MRHHAAGHVHVLGSSLDQKTTTIRNFAGLCLFGTSVYWTWPQGSRPNSNTCKQTSCVTQGGAMRRVSCRTHTSYDTPLAAWQGRAVQTHHTQHHARRCHPVHLGNLPKSHKPRRPHNFCLTRDSQIWGSQLCDAIMASTGLLPQQHWLCNSDSSIARFIAQPLWSDWLQRSPRTIPHNSSCTALQDPQGLGGPTEAQFVAYGPNDKANIYKRWASCAAGLRRAL